MRGQGTTACQNRI
uniref:Uncharacterized protein n=1 Tax=Arundo donax TaxID=35708 RepID=A0A0A9ENG4_ARUDO